MSLSERINADVKDAMRARDKQRLGVLRMVTAAIKQREVDERTTLDEPAVMAVLEKMLKQRRESVSQYVKGGRDDLAAVERAEIDIISGYLPEKLSPEETAALIENAISQTGAEGPRDMGKVMAWLKQAAGAQLDMGAASSAVKARLGQN
ncbi:MAG: GatB/YqeY domain-containing protein [Gammaproteobacteria bacterium]|nr:GatB/YqeY domain-containing protein [Gammaproteobacteria bacterium]